MVETVKTKVKAKTQGMNKKKLFIIGGVALLVMAGGGYAIYYFRKKKKESGNYFGGSGGSKSGGFSCTSTNYPLSFGTCHPDVGVLQRYLKKTYKADLGSYGKNKDGVDEQFGQITRQTALKYLKKDSFTEKDIAGMKAALKIVT